MTNTPRYLAALFALLWMPGLPAIDATGSAAPGDMTVNPGAATVGTGDDPLEPAATSMDMAVSPDRAMRETIEHMRIRIRKDREIFRADPAQFKALVESEFMPHIDAPYIAQLVLGRHWPGASESQRRRFMSALKDHIVGSYALSLLDYDESTELHWPSTPLTTDAIDQVVPMELVRGDMPPLRVDFSIHLVGTEWKIYDVNASGISLVTNFRGQFNSVIRREGLDALIARLGKHVDRVEAEAQAEAEAAIEP